LSYISIQGLSSIECPFVINMQTSVISLMSWCQ